MASPLPQRVDDLFIDAYGVAIHFHSWPLKSPRAIIQLAHGLGEHALRYEGLVAKLSAAGYEVWADEHRGHGATGLEQWQGAHSRLGRLGPGGLPATIRAVKDFRQVIAEARPGIPTVFLGHSWGSLMGQILLNQGFASNLSAAVFTGTTYRWPGFMNAGDLNARHSHLGTSGAEWLSQDPEVWQRWLDDPLTFKADTLKLFGPVDAARLIGRPKKAPLDIPLLLMVGSDDSLGGERGVRRLERAYRERASADSVTVKVYPEARHEIFNEINRDEVVADLVGWLDNHTLIPGT